MWSQRTCVGKVQSSEIPLFWSSHIVPQIKYRGINVSCGYTYLNLACGGLSSIAPMRYNLIRSIWQTRKRKILINVLANLYAVWSFWFWNHINISGDYSCGTTHKSAGAWFWLVEFKALKVSAKDGVCMVALPIPSNV